MFMFFHQERSCSFSQKSVPRYVPHKKDTNLRTPDGENNI